MKETPIVVPSDLTEGQLYIAVGRNNNTPEVQRFNTIEQFSEWLSNHPEYNLSN